MRTIILLLFVTLFLTDILIVKSNYDLLTILLLLLWVGVVKSWHLEGRFSVLAGLLALLFSCVLLAVSLESIAEKSASWTYLFLVVGIIQILAEKRRKNLYSPFKK